MSSEDKLNLYLFVLFFSTKTEEHNTHSSQGSEALSALCIRNIRKFLNVRKRNWCSTPLSTLRSSSAENRSPVIVLRNLFFINAIRLNERSPEQLETIKHMNMRSAMKTFGNVSCSSSVCINLARSDGDEHPLHLAKVTKCTISSGKTADCRSALYVSVARCA